MPLDPDWIDKLLPEKVIEKAYDDAISPSAKEASKIAVDLVKTARLFLAPFQLTAAFQDRFERFIEKIRTKVPEERLREAPAEVVGPALQQMQYLDEDSPLWQMFEELLTSAVDADAISKVHPSFVHLISQLSRDEAVILYKLRNTEFKIIDTLDLLRDENRFVNLRIELSSVPEVDLIQPKQMGLYYSHLNSLELVTWPVEKQEPIRNQDSVQTGVRRYSSIILTEFGRLFVSACVPDNGFKKA